MSRARLPRTVWLAMIAASACTPKKDTPKDIPATLAASAPAGVAVQALRVESSAFKAQGEIPAKYTCNGGDTPPPLSWSGVPAGAKSIALIVDDPDAPVGTWVHWVAYNLAPSTSALAEGATSLPGAGIAGLNDWKRSGYGGPCPPSGRHRYFFKVYALDVMLDKLAEPTKAALEQAMKGHVIAQGELVATYQKSE